MQLKPGEVFSTHFEAEEGDQLSFGCMFVPSNDTIAGAPAFALFDEKGTPLEGNVTSRAGFYDVGTEESEEPGFGPNQPQRGSGGVVEQQPVTRIDGTDARGNVYPDFASLLRVEITVVSQQ